MAIKFLNKGTFSGDIAGTVLISQKTSIPIGNNSFIGRLSFNAYNVGTTYSTGANITATASSAWSNTSTGARLQFSTTSNTSVNPVNRMVIASNGYVGIDAGNDPGAKLHVNHFGASGNQTIVAVLGSTSLRPVLQFSESHTGASITSGMSIEYNGVGSGDTNYMAINGVSGDARFIITSGGSMQLPTYGAGTLVTDASGNITVSSGGGAGGPYVTTSTTQTISGAKTFSSKIGADGGIDGLTLANGGISGSNYDITGVNSITINDPGEGIIFTGTATMFLNAVDDATDSILKLTNATQLNLNSTARITSLVNPIDAQDAATKNYVDTEVGNIPSGLAFEGNWNASTDTPTLSGTTPDNGKFWIVTVAGATDLSGITDWVVGDWAIYVDNGAGTDAWQKVDNSSTLSGLGAAGKVALWSTTSNVSFNNNFSYDGTYLTTPRVRVGDGTDGYFYSDSAGRTAFTGGDFYIQSVSNAYNYATNNYHGNSSGDNQLFRGNPLSGNNWNITAAGVITATTFSGPLSGNATTATTAAKVTINSDFSGTYPMLVEVESSGTIYNNPSVTYNGTSDTLTSPNFAGILTGTINTATVGTTQTAGNNSTLIATTAYADAAAGAIPIGNYLPLAGGTMTGPITTPNLLKFTGTGAGQGIQFNSATVANDAFGIRVNGGSNAGELEFFSTDDDDEPFVWRHYTSGQGGTGASVEWFRIGAGGNISAAGTITGQNIYGNQFVDAQDNAYYANPAMTSVMKGATFDGNVTVTTQAVGNNSTLVATTAYVDVTASQRTPLNDIRSLGTPAFTNGTNPNITTAQVMAEIEYDGGFDSYSSVFKTSWSYAGNYNLTDAGDFTETAGSSWLTWTDNSSDSARGNITTLAIAPNTGGSAGGVFIYNDQGANYSPGWRQVWTSTTDGSGSGLDADKLDGQEGSYYATAASLGNYLPKANPTFTGTLTGPTLSITGNSVLGNSNNDYVHVNDRLFVGATDSGNSEFWFGEGTTGDVNYGAHWHWDSGYTHKWFTVNNSTETLMMSYATNDTSKVQWFRNFDMNSNKITELATPTASTDAANKAYVDAHGGGVGPFLPIANPTFTGTLTGPTAVINSTTSNDYRSNSNWYGTSSGFWDFRVMSGASSKMRILANGKVGIGTTNPSEKLEVDGKVKSTGIKLMSGTTEYLNTGSYSSNAYIWGYASGSTIYFGQPATWTQNIRVNGTATATNFILSSDKTLKNKIKEIDTNHIDVNWKNFELKSEPGVKRAGVIAQELEEKHPEFVRTDDEGIKSVAYIDLLITKIAELEARLEKAGI